MTCMSFSPWHRAGDPSPVHNVRFLHTPDKPRQAGTALHCNQPTWKKEMQVTSWAPGSIADQAAAVQTPLVEQTYEQRALSCFGIRPPPTLGPSVSVAWSLSWALSLELSLSLYIYIYMLVGCSAVRIFAFYELISGPGRVNKRSGSSETTCFIVRNGVTGFRGKSAMTRKLRNRPFRKMAIFEVFCAFFWPPFLEALFSGLWSAVLWQHSRWGGHTRNATKQGV